MANYTKAKQASIFGKIFSVDAIHYDHFLLPPNDYIRERYFDALRPSRGDRVLELGIGISSFLHRAVRCRGISAFGFDFVRSSLVAQKRSSSIDG